MGQQPSTPRPGIQLEVIGAGLPRTGTSSFNQALNILLDAPAYHGGTQATLGPEYEIRSWIEVLSHWPPNSPSDKSLIRRVLKARLDGYAAVTDSPCNGLVEELLELYPDAKVICTVRDPDAWVKSMATVANAATLWFLRFILFPVPTMRYFPDYINVLRKQWVSLYGRPEPADLTHWNGHVEYLKRVVPENRLVFFDVRDGWEPLCKALGKDIPDVPFPRINDSAAIDDLAKEMIMKGLKSWVAIFAAVGVGAMAIWFMRT
ncbi:P-loop containing nucleoside triphosphate hydrolase protein [Pyrenochaeta sp. MPI-SDFR-AT-0127]|nr:P-loop containing nucleoside triphosphate hydrolase protein [Pyrenochaeta sp. MPI-SDFR-AT-0127]